MKWFEHHTTDRDQAQAKIIRAKFGAEGYGIYVSLLEVIGENVLENNQDEWGQVAKIHDVESLAIECATTAERLREFLEFCNEREIFEKKNGRLYTSLILDRLDNYAKRLMRKVEPSSDKVRTRYEQSSTNDEQSTTLHTQSQKQTQVNNTSGSSPLGDVLSSKTFKKNGKQIQPWQEEAVRFAENLGIDLSVLPKGQAGSWFKCFKLAANGKNRGNLYQAYSYLADHPGDLDNEGKVMMFFKIWNNGLGAHETP